MTMVLPATVDAPPCTGDVPVAERVDSWREWLRRDPVVVTAIPPASSGMAKRVLLISYMYPPTGGSAVQRPAKLAKYLPLFGWQVEVFAADHERFPWADPSLLDDIADAGPVHRVAGWEPACLAQRIGSLTAKVWPRTLRKPLVSPSFTSRVEDSCYWRLTRLAGRVGLGDGASLWIGSACRAALRLHRHHPFDAIVSTGPPHFVHRVAMRLARRTGCPWVADLRDPLVSDFDRTPAGDRHVRAMRRLERDIMVHADAIVTTCPALAEEYRRRYRPRAPRMVRAITNGFDKPELQRALAFDSPISMMSSDCLFVAAGSFYGRREIARLVEPLQRVLAAHPQWRQHVRLAIAGTVDAEQRRRWERDRPDWLTFEGYLDHASAIRLAARAACNILIVPDCQHGRLSIPGKTFELLALPAHVLALVPPGSDTERIVRAAGGASTVPFEDADRIAHAIEGVIAKWLAGRPRCDRNWSSVDTYDRRAVAASFAECLELARTGRSRT